MVHSLWSDLLGPRHDDARDGETILLAKAGKPWAQLMPLAPPLPQRIPGRLRSQGTLSHPDVLLEPMVAPHRNPLDGLLAAQAHLERLVLLTADPQLSTFPCRPLW